MLHETYDVCAAEKGITEHYFTSAGDWWICEYDPDSGQAFGYARLANMPDYVEWGYIYLPELEEINAHIGLTPSDAFRMLLCRTVAEGRLPFEPLAPLPSLQLLIGTSVTAVQGQTPAGDPTENFNYEKALRLGCTWYMIAHRVNHKAYGPSHLE